MTTYSQYSNLLNDYNLTGQASGTLSVLGITLGQDAQGRYIVTYRVFDEIDALTGG